MGVLTVCKLHSIFHSHPIGIKRTNNTCIWKSRWLSVPFELRCADVPECLQVLTGGPPGISTLCQVGLKLLTRPFYNTIRPNTNIRRQTNDGLERTWFRSAESSSSVLKSVSFLSQFSCLFLENQNRIWSGLASLGTETQVVPTQYSDFKLRKFKPFKIQSLTLIDFLKRRRLKLKVGMRARITNGQ